MPTNKHRFPLRHANGYGDDWANSWDSGGTLHATEFLTRVRAAQTGSGMVLRRIYVENNNMTCGIGPLLLDAKWFAGQYTAVGTVYTDDTGDAQSGTANTFPLETLINNDGHMVASREKFSAIRYAVTTAAVPGAGYVQEWAYWDGSAFVVLVPTVTTATLFRAIGTAEVCFQVPLDWAPTSIGTGANLRENVYVIRYRATNAPDTAALASRIYVVHPMRVPVGSVDVVTTEWFNEGMPVASDGESLWAMHPLPAAGQFCSIYGTDVGEAGQLGQQEGRNFV